MARNKLTDKKIKGSLDAGRYSDGAGLYLRVRETGSKSLTEKELSEISRL
jgi:hypothetical protein